MNNFLAALTDVLLVYCCCSTSSLSPFFAQAGEHISSFSPSSTSYGTHNYRGEGGTAETSKIDLH